MCNHEHFYIKMRPYLHKLNNHFIFLTFSPVAPSKYKDFAALQSDIVHSSLLEELIFWTFKYEFPQNFVCFLLNMLPDPDYKVIK